MKLLVLTQTIDLKDPVLGFFHRWVVEMSRHFESVIVICLYLGENELPENVRVFSLGKETHASRSKYVRSFLHLIWSMRHEYDAVFVHMNQEYIVLGGIIWKLLGKRIFMWRNHYHGSILTDIAAFWCTKVFCTSAYSYTAHYSKTVLMPVGVDTDFFVPIRGVARVPRSILSLGRVAPSKRLNILIEALGLLKKRSVSFSASIYGDHTPEFSVYHESLKERCLEFDIADLVAFYPGIPNTETPQVYSRHQIFVNLSPDGMYDKTIFEAASCGCDIVATNSDLIKLFGSECVLTDLSSESLALKLEKALAADVHKDFRALTIEKHSLRLLGERLTTEMK